MSLLTDEQITFLLRELRELEVLAESLKHEIGNETTLEFHERIREIKHVLDLEEWR